MNPPAPYFPTAGDPSPPRKEVQLQGPRPTPLKIRKDSHKIKKPPLAAKPPQRQQPAAPPQPVIIYAVSPKVIHTDVSEFMTLVQRLTGPSPSSSYVDLTAGDFSPAARLASIEKTSPSEREKEKERAQAADDLMMDLVEGVEVGQFPGILSPAPASLPPISAGFFSPVSDPHTLSILNDLSPFLHGNNSFLPSPSAFFTAPIISPTPSFDLLNQFCWDF